MLLLQYMLKYDTVHGRFDGSVSHDDSSITVNGEAVKVPRIAESFHVDHVTVNSHHALQAFDSKDPGAIDWGSAGADYVVEVRGSSS